MLFASRMMTKEKSSMVTFTEQGGLKSILWFWNFLSLMQVKTRYALTKLSSGIWRILNEFYESQKTVKHR